MKAGYIFEKEMRDAYEWAFRRFYNSAAATIMLSSSRKEDVERGTDFWDGDIPIDFTLNFEGKNNMFTVFPKTVNISRWFPEFQFGIRTGNNYAGGTRFQTPVLVVGVDMAPYEFFRERNFLMECVYDHIQEIMETGEELFYLFQDQHPEMFT